MRLSKISVLVCCSPQGRVVCEFKYASFSCPQRRQHIQVSESEFILVAGSIILLHVAMQDQTEKEMSMFVAQALQRVVNVVCNIYNTAF